MSEVLTAVDAGVLTITINREDKKNALTNDMYTALADALEAAVDNSDVRVVVVQGSERVFSAGNDLGDFQNTPAEAGLSRPVFRFLHTLAVFPKPLVAAVCGPAVGIGTTMLLHCDLVYAGTNAKLSLPFVNLGLCPEAASSLLLPKVVGHARAAELLMLGEPFSPQLAYEAGLVNAVLEPDEVLPKAQETAAKLAAKPAKSLRVTKELLRPEALRQQILERIEHEGQTFSAMLHEPAAREAFAAFMEKRRPDFSGM